MKDQYLTHDSSKSQCVQFKAFKDMDSKEVGGLPKLIANTDVLSWINRMEEHLRKIPGVDFYPLAYLLCENEFAAVTTIDLLLNKCYSVTHASMIEECAEQKFQRDTCAETDKITLF